MSPNKGQKEFIMFKLLTTAHDHPVMLGALAGCAKEFNSEAVPGLADLAADAAVVVVHEEFVHGVSGQCLAAVLAHEEGHVVLGHIYKTGDAPTTHGVVDCLQFELEADAYAAKRVGALTMRDSLKESLTFILATFVARGLLPADALEEATQKSLEAIKPRLDALEALAAKGM